MNVYVLRDTGGNQTLITKQVCEFLDISHNSPTEYVVLQTVDGSQSVPIISVYLKSEIYQGPLKAAVVDKIPVQGIGCILENNIFRDICLDCSVKTPVPTG